MSRARSKPFVEFPRQPGPYITNASGTFSGEERTPLAYHAYHYHRGYAEYRTWGVFWVKDYASPEAARKAAMDLLDARQRNGEIAYLVSAIYVL